MNDRGRQAIIESNKRRARHKMAHSPEYRAWGDMKWRCLKPQHKSFKNYGGRGISVCERWMKFDNFFADMGKRPTRCSLDRINNNGNYEPGNCRWATYSEQQKNRRNSRVIEFHGIILNISEWADVFGITPDSLSRRLKRGWNIDRAISDRSEELVYDPLKEMPFNQWREQKAKELGISESAFNGRIYTGRFPYPEIRRSGQAFYVQL